MTFDAHQGKIGHGFQKYGDGAYVFTKGAVILQRESQYNTNCVIQAVSCQECPEHDPCHIVHMCQEQGADEKERQPKGDIPDPPPAFPWLLWNLIRQEIQNHRSPAGITAPSPPEDERAKNLRHRVVDGCRFKDACKEVVPESLNLHIFIAEQSEIDQHIGPYQKLGHSAGMFELDPEQKEPDCQRCPDIAEIKQIKQVLLCKPKRNGYGFKKQPHEGRQHER